MRDAEPTAPLATGPLSIDEVNNLYPLQWVLLKVTGKDAHGVITQGEVIDHSPHRGKLNRAVKQLHAKEPDAHIFVFLGGTRFGAGDRLRTALRGLSELDDVDAGS